MRNNQGNSGNNPFVFRQPQFVSPPQMNNNQHFGPPQTRPRNNGGFNLGFNAQWNPMNMYGSGALPPPSGGNNNQILTDEQFARKLQAEENSKAFTNNYLPRRFQFKQPSYFDRRKRKRELLHQSDRGVHRNSFKESTDRKKIEENRNMEYRKKKFLSISRRRQVLWNQRRKMNNHSSKMALSRFPRVLREIGGKKLTIDELLEGCYYTPGVIRGRKNNFQHKLDFTFPMELPRQSQRNLSFPPPPPPSQQQQQQQTQFPVQINNNGRNSRININITIPGPPPFSNPNENNNNNRKIVDIPESFVDDDDEEDEEGDINFQHGLEEGGEEPEEVEICFIIDCTGSMVNILDQMKRDIESIIAQLLKDIPGVRFSFVVFGDYSDFRMYYLVKKLDFSNDPRHIKNFLQEINGTGGGSNPEEAYGLALLEARALSWGRAKAKFAILIGDSVPYEVEKDPLGIDWRKVVQNKTMRTLNSGNKDVVRVIPIQCLTLDPRVTRFYEEVGENRIAMRKFEILLFFEVFLAICYQGKEEDELEELVKNFEGLSIDNVKKFHFQLNKNPFGNK